MPRRLILTGALTVILRAASLEAQVSGQSFQVTLETGQATVGDTVQVRFRVRLDERDLLFDTTPGPLGALAPGVRILSIDKLARAPDRIFHGKARLAFYRPGRQPVPVFMLSFMRAVKGVQRAALASDSAFVDIGSLLPAGNPPLKDIREIELNAGPSLGPLVAAGVIALLLLGGNASRRRHRLPAVAPAPTPPAQELPTTPYAQALAQLERIERERWPTRGAVARYYEEIVDVLRGYLDAREGIPAREQTTEELLWALSPHLTEDGLRETLRELLDEADLVKFARLLPRLKAADLFLERSRSLLQDWHDAVTSSQVADALC